MSRRHAIVCAILAALTAIGGAWIGRADERARWQDGTGLDAPAPVVRIGTALMVKP